MPQTGTTTTKEGTTTMMITWRTADGSERTAGVLRVHLTGPRITGFVEDKDVTLVPEPRVVNLYSGNVHDTTDHAAHSLLVDYPDFDGEAIAWCATCDTTLDYLAEDEGDYKVHAVHSILHGAW